MGKCNSVSDFDKGHIVMARRLGQNKTITAALVGCLQFVVVRTCWKSSNEEKLVDWQQSLTTKAHWCMWGGKAGPYSLPQWKNYCISSWLKKLIQLQMVPDALPLGENVSPWSHPYAGDNGTLALSITYCGNAKPFNHTGGKSSDFCQKCKDNPYSLTQRWPSCIEIYTKSQPSLGQ